MEAFDLVRTLKQFDKDTEVMVSSRKGEQKAERIERVEFVEALNAVVIFCVDDSKEVES